MATLFPNAWGVSSGIDHQEGRGIVTVFHGFFWDKAEEDPIWARGRPTDIRYLVRGNLVYDPRYPTEGPDSDGWIWDYTDNPSLNQAGLDNHPGQNPALQILDYLTSKRYGLGVPYAARDGGSVDEIDEPSFEAMAIHCDEDVTTTGLDTNVTLPRYTSNAIISTGDSHKSNLERLLGACNGMLVYEGNKFKLLPRKSQTAVSYEIDESQIIGDIEVVREGSSVPNIITVRFPSEDHDYELQNYTWPIGAFDDTQNAFLEADNSVANEKTIDLPAVTDFIHAQHLAMTLLREMREDVIVGVTCRESAIQLSVGDIVNLTYDSAGWSQKPFRIVGMEIHNDGTVHLQLKEYASSVYSLDPNEDIPTVPGTDLPNPFTVIAPTVVSANCAAGYYLQDGVFKPRVEVTWTHSVDPWAKEEELVYKKDTDTEWIFTGIKNKIVDTAVASWETDLELGVDYDFGVVAWNHLNIRSTVAEASGNPCTITGPTDTPTDVTITDSDFTCLEGITIKWDNPDPYTDANSIGVREIQFYFTEIREQGAGATELDRWNAGTFIDNVVGTYWNLPFDETVQGTYDLTLRRHDRFGNPQTTPTEVQLILNDWPCAGFGENEPSEYGAMIHNGGFENGGRWWYSATGGAISASSPLAGSYSLAMTAGGAERTCRQVSDLQDDITLGVGEDHFIKVNEGDWFVLGAYGSTTGATGRVRVRTYDRDHAYVATEDCVTFTTSSPTRKNAFVNIDTDIEYIVVECSIDAGSGVAKFDAMGAWLYPPRVPTIKEIITYPTAASGKLEIEINTGTSVLISVEMKKYENQVWDAGWTDVTPSPYDMTVALSEKHPSAITYRVGYDLTATGAGAVEYIEKNVNFDIDTLPELGTPSFDVDTDTGDVILHWSGDDDVLSIKYETAATDWASDAAARTAAQGGTALNNRSGSATLSGAGLPVPESDVVYVAILAYTAAGGTGTESTEVYRATVTRGSITSVIAPTIQSQMDYSGSNGQITLVINDPQTRVTQVRYDTWSGTALAWAGWTIDPSSPWGPWSVALDEKHDSHIRWEVRYTDPTGGVFLEGNATFDVDTFPEISSKVVHIDDAGAATLEYHGDDDVGSIKWAVSTSAFPSGATVDANSCPTWCNDDRSEGALPLQGGSVAVGDTLFVSFYAFTGAGGTGTKNPLLYQAKATRYTSTSIILPTVQAQVTGASNNEATLVINDPQSLVNGVSFRTYENGVWSSWVDDFVAPYTLTESITREEKHNTMIAWKVRYDYGPGNKNIENVLVFDPDTTPEVNSVSVDVNDAGTVYLSYTGDDDCLSVKWATSTSDFPNYTTTTTSGTLSDSNTASNINAGSLSEGQTMYISVAAYPQSGGGGTANTRMGWGRVTYGTDDDTVYDTVPANVTGFGNLKLIKGTSARVRLYWNPVTTPGVTHYEIRYGGTGWSDATFEAEAALNGYNIFYGEIPSSSRTYRIKAMNRAEVLESATAATTTVSFSSRPSGAAASLISSYFRGTGGITRWNLATTNGTLFRFHWGTTSGFTPADTNVVQLITEDNPTADYAVGISLAETGWTDDSGRTLYLKVGVKDGASDDLGEGWSYSSGYSITLNPFETKHIPEDVTREFISGAYTDSSRRPTTLRKTSSDLSANDAFDKTADDTTDITEVTLREFINGNYTDSSRRPTTLRDGTTDVAAGDVYDKTRDTYVTIGAQKQVTYSTSAPGSPGTGDIWVDTNAVPVKMSRWTGSVWDKIGNLTEGALALLDEVDTAQIAAKAITRTKIDDLAVDTPQLNAGAVTAAKITAGTITGNEITGNTLSGIFVNAGVLTAGEIRNSAGVNFIDMDASGTELFIKAGDNFSVTAAGVAVFGGEVSSSTFTSSAAKFESSAGNYVEIGSTAGAATIDLWRNDTHRLRLSGGSTSGGQLSIAGTSNTFAVLNNTNTTFYRQTQVYRAGGNNFFTIASSTNPVKTWHIRVASGGSGRLVFLEGVVYTEEFYHDPTLEGGSWGFDGTLSVNKAITSSGMLFIGNRTGDPSTPTNGTYLYCKSGVLYLKGTDGNVRRIGTTW
jgi:hypothetical protein